MWIVLVLMAMAVSFSLHAETCADAVTQSAMNACAGQAFKKTDDELNTAYKHILERLKDDAEKVKLLTAAERAWIVSRDADCKFTASSVEGGSLYPTIWASCLDDATKERLKKLQNYLKCGEGDLSCPVPTP